MFSKSLSTLESKYLEFCQREKLSGGSPDRLCDEIHFASQNPGRDKPCTYKSSTNLLSNVMRGIVRKLQSHYDNDPAHN